MCSLNCTKAFSLSCIAANKNCQVQLFLKFNVMEVWCHFFHSFENSCRKTEFTGVFPHRSCTLHLSPSVNNWYKWTPVKSQRVTLFLWCSYDYISMERIKGISGRRPPKNDFSSFRLSERRKKPTTFIRSTKQRWENNRSLKIHSSLTAFFLTSTAVSNVPTNIHMLKGSLVDVLQNTSTAI